jgi:hypothetical protein
VLEKAGERVIDVQGEDLGDDEDDHDPAANDVAAAYGTPDVSDYEDNDTDSAYEEAQDVEPSVQPPHDE